MIEAYVVGCLQLHQEPSWGHCFWREYVLKYSDVSTDGAWEGQLWLHGVKKSSLPACRGFGALREGRGFPGRQTVGFEELATIEKRV